MRILGTMPGTRGRYIYALISQLQGGFLEIIVTLSTIKELVTLKKNKTNFIQPLMTSIWVLQKVLSTLKHINS